MKFIETRVLGLWTQMKWMTEYILIIKTNSRVLKQGDGSRYTNPKNIALTTSKPQKFVFVIV